VKFSLEKVRLILAVEGDLKPNPTVSLGNRPERDRLDFQARISLIIPPKEPSGFFSTRTTNDGLSAISRSFGP
jgi:hypothetical protein